MEDDEVPKAEVFNTKNGKPKSFGKVRDAERINEIVARELKEMRYYTIEER